MRSIYRLYHVEIQDKKRNTQTDLNKTLKNTSKKHSLCDNAPVRLRLLNILKMHCSGGKRSALAIALVLKENYMQEWREAWYLLRCRENAWRRTLENLNNVGLKTCCPLIHERRRRKDKKNTFRLVDSPAFPGYIFVHLDPSQIHTTAIKRIPGAMDFVHFGNKLATVHHREIEALRMAEPKVLTADPVSYECANLPPELLSKIEEIYTTADPKHRVNLLISMLALPKRLWSKNAN